MDEQQQVIPQQSKKTPFNWTYVEIGAVVVFVIASAGFLVYKNQQEPKQVSCTAEAKICPDGSSVARSGPDCKFAKCPVVEKNIEESDQTSNWKTYRNEEFGFEFKYPSDYVVENLPDVKVFHSKTGEFSLRVTNGLNNAFLVVADGISYKYDSASGTFKLSNPRAGYPDSYYNPIQPTGVTSSGRRYFVSNSGDSGGISTDYNIIFSDADIAVELSYVGGTDFSEYGVDLRNNTARNDILQTILESIRLIGQN